MKEKLLGIILCSFAALSCSKLGSSDSGYGSILDLYDDSQELTERIISLRGTSQNLDYRPLVLLQFSDIHGDGTNFSRLLDFYSVFSSDIDDIICCGDMLTNDFENDFSWWSKCKLSGQVLVSVGNHDTTSYSESKGYSWTAYCGKDSYDKFFAPNVRNWDVVNTSPDTYYYKDYNESEIRLIVLDCMNYDEVQESWLVKALDGALKANMSVVAVSHYPVASFVPIECNYSTEADLEAGIVNPYWSHSSKVGNAVNVVDDFISKGGDFICWMGGHLHKNAIGYLPKHNNQIILLAESSSSSSEITCDGDAMRVKGGKNQDSFNVIGFDALNHTISVIKIGADIDMVGRSRKFLSLDYLDCRILESY